MTKTDRLNGCEEFFKTYHDIIINKCKIKKIEIDAYFNNDKISAEEVRIFYKFVMGDLFEAVKTIEFILSGMPESVWNHLAKTAPDHGAYKELKLCIRYTKHLWKERPLADISLSKWRKRKKDARRHAVNKAKDDS